MSHLQESDQADDCFLTMKARLDLQQFISSKEIWNDLHAGQVSQTANGSHLQESDQADG